MPDWKDCEGQLLDGKRLLERYVGGDESSAFFRSASAAVRVHRADAPQAAALLDRWNRMKLLHHPHLLEIDHAAASEIASEPVAYVVMENAEENLAEILDGRPLTTEETREMLLQVAGALDFLHSRGMAHGDLKASNIFAIGNTIKISSDSVTEGDPAADIRALGFTLIHALTQHANPPAPDVRELALNLRAPFGEIATGCLHPNPAQRWTASRIVERLTAPAAPAPSPPKAAIPFPPPRPRRRSLAAPVGLALAGVAVLAAVMMRRPDVPPPAPVEPQPQPQPRAAVVAPAPPVTPPAPKSVPPAPIRSNDPPQSTRDRVVIENGVTRRVLPDIPAKARDTIDGRPAVVVRVSVDPAGNVTDAAVQRSFSPYFSKAALQAARQWKFVPEEGASPRDWTLRFVFTRANTQAVAQKSAGK
jgi:TonB family protein